MCSMTKQEYLATAARQADRLASNNPGAAIPVAPDVADFMGAFHDDAIPEEDLDDALTPEEMGE